MLHSISFFLVLLLFSFITIENKAFSPLEFLQHLQQQQHLDFQPQESPQQNQVPMQQPPPQLPRQQPQGQPTPQPLTQEEPPKEQFKPFCGKSPLTLK